MKTKRSMAGMTVCFACALVSSGLFALEGERTNNVREPMTQQLIAMVEHNEELKTLLVKSIKKAKAINADRQTNPAQTLDEYYDFMDWAAKAMPWSILPDVQHPKLYEQIDRKRPSEHPLCRSAGM